MTGYSGLRRAGRRPWLLAMLATLTAVCNGCDAGSDRGTTLTRDSAGVVVVESRSAAWTDDTRWRLAESPFLEIGTVEGSPQYQFHRVEGVVRLDDGRFVVADGGSCEIRFFDGEGLLQATIGGPGDAPGEFRMISGLGAGPGDSLWVFDYGNRRFTVLAADGEPARTVSVGGSLSAVDAVGRLPDGSFVVKEGWGSPRGGATRAGLTRDPVVVAVFSSDGSAADTLGTFPGREVFLSVEDGRGVMSTPLFSHNTSAVLWEDAVFVGDQEKMEVGLYKADGTLRRLLRVPDFDLHLGAADVEARMRQVLEQQPADRRIAARNQIEGMDVPNSRPAYGRLLAGADGSLWAAEEARYPDIPRNWTVFGPDGGLLGTAVMPERFKVFQVGFDWVLGVGLDDLDVEYVRLYRLEK